MDLVLGELCGINRNRNINPAVDRCCKTSFAFRRPCFDGLEADKTYVPPPTSEDLSTFPTDLCETHNEELQRKKNRYIYFLPFIFFFRLKRHCIDKKVYCNGYVILVLQFCAFYQIVQYLRFIKTLEFIYCHCLKVNI